MALGVEFVHIITVQVKGASIGKVEGVFGLILIRYLQWLDGVVA